MKTIKKFMVIILTVAITLFSVTGCNSISNHSKSNSSLKSEKATQKAYSEYSKVLTDLMDEYGSLRTSRQYYYSYFLGVNFVDLVDFDNNGIDELYVIYATDGDYRPEYTYEVWGIQDGYATGQNTDCDQQ